ncbi:hypothetical protein PMAYCL1PPCAC_21543, partial [Pristionchus mayeri]
VSLLYDIHFDVLFLAHPIVPIFGGYCYGLLCAADMSMNMSISSLTDTLYGITVSMIGNVGVAVLMCLVHRHQTILPPSNAFKFNEKIIWSAHAVLAILLSMPGALLALLDATQSDRLIDE